MCASPHYLCIPVRELLIINLNQLLQMLVLSLSISLGLREQLLPLFPDSSEPGTYNEPHP